VTVHKHSVLIRTPRENDLHSGNIYLSRSGETIVHLSRSESDPFKEVDTGVDIGSISSRPSTSVVGIAS